MFGRLITCIAAGLTAVLVVASGGAASGYGNGVSTSCNVSVSAKAGKPISAFIDVKGNASSAVTGDVTISVFRSGSAPRMAARAAAVWTKTVHYNGTPLTITGPALPRGSYRAVAKFSADPGVFLDCQCFGSFRTKSVAGEHHTNGGGGNGLPNTGGPSEWWLIAGFGLVLAGGAATYAGRRRRTAAHA
ncbi:MAG TPA: LPXTG cell wall anchor domain-containing protein [Nocardioides sp.]|nr:LPXTG cell wall anchor domain-containing protein [Nocardioides sp.]